METVPVGRDAGPTTTTMTDGGVETTLVFHDGFDLPDFAAFPLLEREDGRRALEQYYRTFLELAASRGLPLALGTPTWRANRDWGARLGYSPEALAAVNVEAVRFVREVVDRFGEEAGRSAAETAPPVLIEGILGPRGDGYVVSHRMTAEESERYHSPQIEALRDAGADRVAAVTLTYPEEAIGIARAGGALGMPVVLSFTVEVDGRLPDGTALGDAIALVDETTDGAAEFFAVNCAHPTHIVRGLEAGDVAARIGGLRPNASTLSHAELDAAEELDEGDPVALGRDTAALRGVLPNVTLLGGCCGTDVRHVAEIVAAWD